MKNSVKRFFCTIFPFLTTLVLWRLSVPFWNPAGILAIIPIFYCSFVKPVPWFSVISILFCFLIDYKFNTLVYWTVLYCLVYSINGFQGFIDLPRAGNRAIVAFMIFFGVGVLILSCVHISLSNVIRALWIFCLASILYIPITGLIARICDDR
ncbi:MAG: hypothetical protein MJ187_00655 [Alphaproteobacteria bacterium]|nr:hypothetical protein [Alphaproteobacteria bacterium]